MVYRYRPKEHRVDNVVGKKVTSITDQIRDKLGLEKQERTAFGKQRRISRDNKTMVAALVILGIFVIYFVGTSVSGYMTYAENVANELQSLKSDLEATEAQRASLSTQFSACENNLNVKNSELSDCIDLRVRYKSEIDNWKNEYDKIASDYESCTVDKAEADNSLNSCVNDLNEVREIETNYRNYKCCITKLGHSVDKMFWKVVNSEIVCQLDDGDGFTEVAVSELSC